MPTGEYLQYGGQAIIEGVMMRSPKHFAVACRAPNGQIVLQEEALAKTWIGRQNWLKQPFLRGTLAMLDAMALGIRAMNFASRVQLEQQFQIPAGDDEPVNVAAEAAGAATTSGLPTAIPPLADDPLPAPEAAGRSEEGSEIVRPQSAGGGSMMKVAVGSVILLSLGIGFLLFQATPVWIAQLFAYANIRSPYALNLIEGLIKAIIFLGYIYLVGRFPDVREVFKYHGAEHKAINCLEAGEELTLENAKAQTRLHPRCGTSFIIIVLFLSIVVFAVVPRDFHTGNTFLNLLIRIGLKIPILPLIAGVAYEAIRFAGKFRNEKWVMALFWPGLKTQYLTTVEPEDRHIEVALVALRSVVQQEANAKELKQPEPALA